MSTEPTLTEPTIESTETHTTDLPVTQWDIIHEQAIANLEPLVIPDFNIFSAKYFENYIRTTVVYYSIDKVSSLKIKEAMRAVVLNKIRQLISAGLKENIDELLELSKIYGFTRTGVIINPIFYGAQQSYTNVELAENIIDFYSSDELFTDFTHFSAFLGYIALYKDRIYERIISLQVDKVIQMKPREILVLHNHYLGEYANNSVALEMINDFFYKASIAKIANDVMHSEKLTLKLLESFKGLMDLLIRCARIMSPNVDTVAVNGGDNLSDLKIWLSFDLKRFSEDKKVFQTIELFTKIKICEILLTPKEH